MKTIEAIATVTPEHTLTVRVPADIRPGDHRIVLVIEDNRPGGACPPLDLPSHDLGPWPEGLSLRREDLYDDWGR